jgi:hypothetical protein
VESVKGDLTAFRYLIGEGEKIIRDGKSQLEPYEAIVLDGFAQAALEAGLELQNRGVN